jgi:hypothetical protein
MKNDAPGRSPRFAGKPRHSDERFHAHIFNVGIFSGVFKALAGAIDSRSPAPDVAPYKG